MHGTALVLQPSDNYLGRLLDDTGNDNGNFCVKLFNAYRSASTKIIIHRGKDKALEQSATAHQTQLTEGRTLTRLECGGNTTTASLGRARENCLMHSVNNK